MSIPLHPETPTALQLYSVFRGQIERETDSLNQRTIWNVISQSFFFSAYAVTLNAPKEPRSPFYASMQDFFIWMLPIAAFVAAALMIVAVFGSLVTMRQIRKKWESEVGEQANYLPAIEKSPFLRGVDYLTPGVLPLAFLVVWGLVLSRLL